MAEPRHNDHGICVTCGGGMSFIECQQSTGLGTYEVLDAWWAHDAHPDNGHDAKLASILPCRNGCILPAGCDWPLGPPAQPQDGCPNRLALASAVAKQIATAAHAGQVDKIGEPYIGHPTRIASGIRVDGYSDDVEAVAWLHDVVEDTIITLNDLRRRGFSDAVVDAVDAISKRKGEPFADYYERVKANPIALVVKWHDVADNADPRRLAKVAPDTRQRLAAKYERARAMLRGEGR